MENPHAHNPLVVMPRGKVSRVIISYIAQMFGHVGVSATFYVRMIEEIKEYCAEYERGILITPLVPGEKFSILIQLGTNERYKCEITSPEMRKKDIHTALTARLTGEVFRIEAHNPPPQEEQLVATAREFEFKEYVGIRRQLSKFDAQLTAIGTEEAAALAILEKIQARRHALCEKVVAYVEKHKIP